MEFMAKFRLQNKGKGWNVVEMAKEGGKAWRGRNGTVRKGKKTRGGAEPQETKQQIAELTDKITTLDTNIQQMNEGEGKDAAKQDLEKMQSDLKMLENELSNSGATEDAVISQAKSAASGVEDAAKNALGSLFSTGGRRHRKRRGGFAEYNTGGKRRTKSRRR